jgi:truncated hemoglobin YjbI
MAFEILSAKEQEIVLRCMSETAAHVADSEKRARV